MWGVAGKDFGGYFGGGEMGGHQGVLSREGRGLNFC